MKRTYPFVIVVLILALASLACGLGGILGGNDGGEATVADQTTQDTTSSEQPPPVTSNQDTSGQAPDSSQGSAPEATATPVETDTTTDTSPSEGGEGAGADEFEEAPIDSAQVNALDSLNSYRSELLMTFEGTSQGQPVNGTISVQTEVTKNPSAQHFRVDLQGSSVTDGPENMELEMYFIDDSVYMHTSEADGWLFFAGQALSEMNDVIYTPQDFMALPANARRKLVPEMVNGILAWHYVLKDEDLADANVAFEQAEANAWIAVDGGFLVKSEYFGKGRVLNPTPGSDFFEEGSIQMTYNLTEINGTVNIVLPPEAAAAAESSPFGAVGGGGGGWSRQDIPLPTDAEIQLVTENFAQLLTAMSVQEATDFMRSQLEANGWAVSGEPMTTDAGAFVDFEKSGETVSLVVGEDTGGSGRTSIFITIQ